MENYAILKMINYQESTPERAERLSKYMSGLVHSSGNPKNILTNCLSAGNTKADLDVIKNRWMPNGTRCFKQCVLSFGRSVSEMPSSTALEVTEKTMDFFASYPWIAAIHTNKPKHLHAHILLCTINFENGHKLSQSRDELKKFKLHYNGIARDYGLPPIPVSGEGAINDTSKALQPIVTIRRTNSYPSAFEQDGDCFDCSYEQVSSSAYASHQNSQIENIWRFLRESDNTAKTYFNLGYLGGMQNG